MARCNCAPHPTCNPKPNGPSPLNYDGNRQAPHPYVYWMSRRTVNVEAGKNVDVELCVDEPTGDKTYTVSAKTDPEVTSHLQQLDSEVARKAEKTYVDRELAKKADKTTMASELAKKADRTYVDSELAKKADKTAMAAELAKKADKTTMAAELAKKADKTTVAAELAKKADKTYVDAELAKKADTTTMAAELAKKADKTTMVAELAKKADKTTMAEELDKKADITYVNDELSKKANQSDVETALATKANIADVEAALLTKVDKEEGKGLYPDTDKEKLAGIPADSKEKVQDGHELSLVTTGEKYTWDSKQDHLDYYLEKARINGDGDLEIDRFIDGSTDTITFSVTGAINHIALEDYCDLDIDGSKRVTIPLASTDGNIPGIVRGESSEFNEGGEITP